MILDAAKKDDGLESFTLIRRYQFHTNKLKESVQKKTKISGHLTHLLIPDYDLRKQVLETVDSEKNIRVRHLLLGSFLIHLSFARGGKNFGRRFPHNFQMRMTGTRTNCHGQSVIKMMHNHIQINRLLPVDVRIAEFRLISGSFPVH